MNTHRLRPMSNRRNIAPCTLLLLLAGIVAAGFAAGTMQSSAEAGVANGRGHQLPPEFANRNPEDNKKDFNDDDLKVKDQKPRGKWGFGIGVDKAQFNDASVPVAIGALQSLSGGGKYAGVFKIKRLEIKNRSPKALNAVQLRWEIVDFDDPAKVLLEGTTPFVNFRAEANSSQVVEIPAIYPDILFKPLAQGGELNGRFKLRIGLQEVRFADGSFWRRRGPVVGFNYLYYDPIAADRPPRLASLSLTSSFLWSDPGNRRLSIRPCEAKPRSSASAFSSMPLQTMTCHDDMNVFINPDTLRQSCGTPSPGDACYANCSADGWCNVDIVPGGRCSPPPPPTPPPTPTPMPFQPNSCCVERHRTVGSIQLDERYWDCRPPKCPANTQFLDGCYSLSGPVVSCPNPEMYEPVFTESYGAACCPRQLGDGCTAEECEGDVPEDRGGNTVGLQTDEGQCPCASPILVDVLGDGFRLTGLAGGVRFDLNGDGRAGRLAWTEPGSDDAWLALDRDGDGAVTSGRELFGNLTPQPAPPAGVWRNGFLALAEFDRVERGGNSDGVVDARDAVFASLRLWRDLNHDGVSQPQEVFTLPALDVVRLRLDYKESKREDAFGNRFKYRAKADDARGAKVNRWAWDVFLLAGQ